PGDPAEVAPSAYLQRAVGTEQDGADVAIAHRVGQAFGLVGVHFELDVADARTIDAVNTTIGPEVIRGAAGEQGHVELGHLLVEGVGLGGAHRGAAGRVVRVGEVEL